MLKKGNRINVECPVHELGVPFAVGKLVHIAGVGGKAELPEYHADVRRKELHKRYNGHVKVVTRRHWKDLIGIHWIKRSSKPIHRIGKITLHFHLEKSSRPQSKLLGV